MGRSLLGYDVGSSSVKATLLDIETGTVLAAAVSPKTEMAISAPLPGWAEQDPQLWWQHLVQVTAEIARAQRAALREVEAIGVSYQMHGLVCLDDAGRVLRPAIIWCDSRAVEIGDRAFSALGPERCLRSLLNSPGNFTASKLRWVRENEPDLYRRIAVVLLPGDYIAWRLTGQAATTPSGLSEAILWDFREGGLASFLLEHYGVEARLIPGLLPSFSAQGGLTGTAAAELGLRAGTPVTYRGGDQPNNALSLNVLNPGEIAATAGTSGVVYGVGSQAVYDSRSRVNTFVHLNHSAGSPRYGTLLCVNGTAILNSWLKHNLMGTGRSGLSYEQMNGLAAGAPVGCDGLLLLPYGNGAERTLDNRNPGSSLHGLDFNRHGRAHLLRAAQEGIVFALNFGLEIMRSMGLSIARVRAGAANMFLSPLFAEAFATVSEAEVELYNTDGAQGAARGAGIGAGIYDWRSAFAGLKTVSVVEPRREQAGAYREAFGRWQEALLRELGRPAGREQAGSGGEK